MDPSSTGLTILVEPVQCDLDVVFVHGFTGHPKRTWAAKKPPAHHGDSSQSAANRHASERPTKMRKLLGREPASRGSDEAHPTFWPLDLLPDALPHARILTYGYDTHLRHLLGPQGSKNTVYDIAKELVVELEAMRRSEPSRPILFIAHSLGGIVVKEALRQSRGHPHHQMRDVFESTAGIFFFGTPHSGADPRGPIQNVAETIIRAAGFTVNKQVVATLLPSSDRLRELRDEFGPMAHEKGWIVYSFQESWGVAALSGHLVVEDHSSCLNDSTVEITQHIHRNHMDMCRFDGPQDVEWKKVAAAIDCFQQRMHERPRYSQGASERAGHFEEQDDSSFNPQTRQTLLDSLVFDQIDAREANIKPAHAKTCQWLLDRSEYQDWLDLNQSTTHHGLLWIKGNPGTGKSTMMKFALQHARKTNPGHIIISFFFNARGDHLEKSTIGLYRSLLFQLLDTIPGLENAVRSSIPKTWSFNEGSPSPWTLETLKSAFRSAVCHVTHKPLVLFIDALDECPEDQVRDMVEHFEDLSTLTISAKPPPHLFFSSRHYPTITADKAVHLVLEDQQEHQEDISRYVSSKLKAKGKRFNDIKVEILRKASGIFLWVVLVIDILNKEYDRGRVRARDLQQRLQELPSGLKELFQDLLLRDSENIDDLVLCLQWILFATCPLEREEFYFAVQSGLDSESIDLWEPEEVTRNDMDRFIRNCSKGLAEVTRSKSATVQFIHESVRDFLLKEDGFSILQPHLHDNIHGYAHNRLKECCLSYMLASISIWPPVSDEMPAPTDSTASAFRSTADKTYPFLKYAVSGVLNHADSAGYWHVPQHEFLEEFPFERWLHVKNWLARYGTYQYPGRPNLIHVLAKDGLSNLIQTMVRGADRGDSSFASRLTCTDGLGRNALHLAVANESIEATTELLDTGRFDVNLRDSKGWTPLLLAAASGSGPLAEVLLTRGNAGPSIPKSAAYGPKKGFKPIHLAAEQGQTAVVRLLVERGNDDPNSADIKLGRSPLRLAALNGHADTVKYLLSTGKINRMERSSNGQTPLDDATKYGYASVVEVFMDHIAAHPTFVESRIATGTRILGTAAIYGRLRIVALLLERSQAYIDLQDPVVLEALEEASRCGYREIVELLHEKRGLFTSTEPGIGASVLHDAIDHGHPEVVRLLLARLANVADLLDNHFEVLLGKAINLQRSVVIGILLETREISVSADAMGVDVNQQMEQEDYYDYYWEYGKIKTTIRGERLLAWLSRHGFECLVKITVADARIQAIDASDEGGMTALMWAARRGDIRIAEALLQTGRVDVNERSHDGLSPLRWAAVGEQEAQMLPAFHHTRYPYGRRGDFVGVARILRDLGGVDVDESPLEASRMVRKTLDIWEAFRRRI